MPEFEKPVFPYSYNVASQIEALRTYRDTKEGRAIPTKDPARLLLATWNIANLGLQERRERDYRLLAEMVGWFDLVALQEVNDNLVGLRELQRQLPPSYRALFSDRAGNKERLAFLYDASRVTLLEKVGEVAIPPSEARYVKLKGSEQRFEGFDRTPYLASFQAGDIRFLLASVHLYFGSGKSGAALKRDMNRRTMETLAVARWADLRRRSPYAYAKDIFALGDFNLPKAEEGDPIFDALTGRGLQLPEHTSKVGSNLSSDKHYDQIAFFPGESGDLVARSGIFDFDGALFRTLFASRGAKDFLAYLRYYISDHRPFWAELLLNAA